MKDLSGVLSSLSDTVIPLPGVIAKSDKQPITLQVPHHMITSYDHISLYHLHVVIGEN